MVFDAALALRCALAIPEGNIEKCDALSVVTIKFHVGLTAFLRDRELA